MSVTPRSDKRIVYFFRQYSVDGLKRNRKTPDATIDGTDAMASLSEEDMGNKGESAKI